MLLLKHKYALCCFVFCHCPKLEKEKLCQRAKNKNWHFGDTWFSQDDDARYLWLVLIMLYAVIYPPKHKCVFTYCTPTTWNTYLFMQSLYKIWNRNYTLTLTMLKIYLRIYFKHWLTLLKNSYQWINQLIHDTSEINT